MDKAGIVTVVSSYKDTYTDEDGNVHQNQYYTLAAKLRERTAE